MSLKLLACLAAAAIVSTGGAYFYTGSGHCCPFSGGTTNVAAETSACPVGTGSCCLTPIVDKPASCCEQACCESGTTDAVTASCGGAITAAKGLK